MPRPRITLLLAALLLTSAELASLYVMVKRISGEQSQRIESAIARATLLIPQIAAWARSRPIALGQSFADPWIEPFDRLSFEDLRTLLLDADDRRRIEAGEIVALARGTDRAIVLVSTVQTDAGALGFRLTETLTESPGTAGDQILLAQHALILLAALAGLVLAALGRETAPAEAGSPALRAYEEAMARLRVRDDERLATFDREKLALTAVLRDREAMARAGELTAGIVHEVRNSIGAIAMHAKFAEKSSDERIAASAALIGDEVRTLQSVMTRFLDFIRTEKVLSVQFDLAQLVNRVAARERSNHDALIDVDGIETVVWGDEDLLERAIENVVRNACQASPDQGRVWVKFGADPTHAFVIVADEGRGIADVEKALRPFESERPGGLGLGLPLALKIMTLHQGMLDLGPRAGREGTLAVCRWPRSADRATTGNDPTRLSPAPPQA